MNKRIKKVRKNLHLTQQEFSKYLHISQSYLSNIETGKFDVTVKIIKDICNLFNINELWLRTGFGEMKNEAFSMDEYVRKKKMNALQLDLIKSLLDYHHNLIPELIRKLEPSLYEIQDQIVIIIDNSIEEQVESFRQELEAEKLNNVISFTKYKLKKTGNNT
jgi:transcriptional regulator with XRE-family HTH domain